MLKVQLSKDDPDIHLKGILLGQLGIPPGQPGFQLFPDGRLSQSLTWAMRVLAMTHEELTLFKQQKAKSHAELEQKLSRDVLQAGFDTIAAVCEDVLNKYPTTEQEDTALLKDSKSLPQESAMRAAITLRRAEKKILQATIRTAKRKMSEAAGDPAPAKKAEL